MGLLKFGSKQWNNLNLEDVFVVDAGKGHITIDIVNGLVFGCVVGANSKGSI